MRYGIGAAVAAGIVALGVYLGVHRAALESGLEQTALAGEARLREAVGRLSGQLQLYRALANHIADDPMAQRFAARAGGSRSFTDYLGVLSLKYGARLILVTDRQGVVTAASSVGEKGRRLPARLIGAALEGRLGYEQYTAGAERRVRFSRALKNDAGDLVGVVVVSQDLAALEFEWPVTPEPVVFLGDDERVFSSNRLSLIPISGGAATAPKPSKRKLAGLKIWRHAGAAALPREAVVLERRAALLGLTARIFLDTAPARRQARQQASLAVAMLLVVSLAIWVAYLQRRRWRSEAEQNAALEARVIEQTDALRAAHNELVESSKLAAMGRLSAGLSHELNQPLAAILNFAQNGEQLIARERSGEAQGNFGAIADQVRRMERIINGLRTFARDEAFPKQWVELREVVDSALNLCEAELLEDGVEVRRDYAPGPCVVLGGQVRLEQVIVNLITNARDAMQNAETRLLTISLTRKDDLAKIDVCDTGPGVADPSRVFEPFYTTKELGASKGLGMGLALAHGIVARLDGQLYCRNEDGGACFTVLLPLTRSEA